MNHAIQEYRMHAAEASGGTSGQEIKALVLKLIRQEGLKGSFLDFGAGKGDLIRRLVRLEGVEELSGADILTRPDDLPAAVRWFEQDLNNDLTIDRVFDVVICSEVIEHLENPRAVFRNLHRLLRPGGALILTMPNQESVRSYAALLLGGHHVHFLGTNYPAHITALVRMDLARMCAETGFGDHSFHYTGVGGIPKMPWCTWQRVSFGLLRGRLFSDNIGMVAKRR
jgi:2-polyprenyl-3-methyl-5-hydroxy-6-metoxy-1,4-benzoquinol methylase